tara:strand:+ start:902 stop:1132 length:231 start_codon:yes stop_codon:yes gene_type:complete
MHKKTFLILLLFTIIVTSCRSKKEVSCPSFDIENLEEEKKKKKSRYSVVILKDGKRINSKKRRKKSRNKLFKKKMY